VIYTTNAIESINISSNKTIKICRSFLTTEDGDQAVLPYAEGHQQEVDYAKRDWKAALNGFTI
jgi:transposase-like protein